MFQYILSVVPTREQRTVHALVCSVRMFMCWSLQRLLQADLGRKVFLNKQQILQRIQSQSRQVAMKCGLGILLALLVVAFLAPMTASEAHAATAGRSYTIVSGDTLSGIAHKFGVSLASLVAANHIADPNLIYTGNTLIIPDGGSPSAPVPPTSQPPHGSYADMIREVFGPYGDGAVHVAMCESGLNPNAYNGVLGAAGLFQIIPGTFSSTSYRGQSVYNPVANIGAAHEIFVRDGYSWREWACKP
jgi:LysM repeat protein